MGRKFIPHSPGATDLLTYHVRPFATAPVQRKLHAALSPQGYTVISFSPGWVKTEMGGPDAPIELEPSVSAGLETLLARGPADGQHFWDYSGVQLDW